MSDADIILKVTLHAEKRIRKRLGVKRSAVCGIVEDAYDNGTRAEDYTGSFRRYLLSIRHNRGSADRAVVHNGFVFYFFRRTLITVIWLPKRYRRAVPKIRD